MVSSRTSREVSIKASTQLQYKTYHTTFGRTIDTPHDYSEVNISTVYTTSWKNAYRKRVGEIVSKRLKLSLGIDVSPQDFFPNNQKQENEIDKIAEEHRKKWKKGEGTGYRAGDDAYRYARPDYMKRLAGRSKSSPTYSYSGYEQLVHISSGIVRNFLEAAARMYSEVKAGPGSKPIAFISPRIQNKVVREMADEFLFHEFDKLFDDQDHDACDIEGLKQLQNLVKALGGLFRKILLSDRSERRVFSIAFSDDLNKDIARVLKLGIKEGYFHVSSMPF